MSTPVYMSYTECGQNVRERNQYENSPLVPRENEVVIHVLIVYRPMRHFQFSERSCQQYIMYSTQYSSTMFHKWFKMTLIVISCKTIFMYYLYSIVVLVWRTTGRRATSTLCMFVSLLVVDELEYWYYIDHSEINRRHTRETPRPLKMGDDMG